MLHDIFVKLVMSFGTQACKWVAQAMTPYFRAFQNALLPFENGTVVSLNGHLYSVVEQRGIRFKRDYKLVDIKSVNPFLLPLFVANPGLVNGRAIMWYRGTGLRKVGHPKLNIRVNLTQKAYGLR